MFRIDTATAALLKAAYPAEGPEKYFQDTDGAGGTIIPAWWFTQIQEEITNVIEDAGITPDKSDDSQLSAAITAMIDAKRPNYVAVTGYNGGGVPADSKTATGTYSTTYALNLLEGVGIDADRITAVHVRCRVFNSGGALGNNFIRASFPSGNETLLGAAHNGATSDVGVEAIGIVPINEGATDITLAIVLGTPAAGNCTYTIAGVTQA